MAADPERIDEIAIVGGGDAGLMTALALEQGAGDVRIDVIDDFEETVPAVGKSTLTFVPIFLHSLLDIAPGRLLREVRLSWKTTVLFEDWCGVGPFHSPLGERPTVIDTDEVPEGQRRRDTPYDLHPTNEARFQEAYYRYQEQEFSSAYGAVAERPGKTPMRYDATKEMPLSLALRHTAYQFDAQSFNQFLRSVCEDRGIGLINDRVQSVDVTGTRIAGLGGHQGQYHADLYVDATGFNRMLMDALGTEFHPFDLPVDTAVVATADIDLDEVVSATVVTSGDAGWFWQIDTPHLRDLGYVYSSTHISEEAAVAEFQEHHAEDINPEDISRYEFESGMLDRAWVGNCVANGNALGFVEPLQSTALSTTAFVATRLAVLLGMHGRFNHAGLRQLFNESTRTTWEEVYQFVSLYYQFNQGETAFWEDARAIDPGEIDHCQAYHASGMSAPDQRQRLTRVDADLNDYYLYHQIMRELGVDSAFYEAIDMTVDPDIARQVEEDAAAVSDRVDEFLTYEEFHAFHPGYD